MLPVQGPGGPPSVQGVIALPAEPSPIKKTTVMAFTIAVAACHPETMKGIGKFVVVLMEEGPKRDAASKFFDTITFAVIFGKIADDIKKLGKAGGKFFAATTKTAARQTLNLTLKVMKFAKDAFSFLLAFNKQILKFLSEESQRVLSRNAVVLGFATGVLSSYKKIVVIDELRSKASGFWRNHKIAQKTVSLVTNVYDMGVDLALLGAEYLGVTVDPIAFLIASVARLFFHETKAIYGAWLTVLQADG